MPKHTKSRERKLHLMLSGPPNTDAVLLLDSNGLDGIVSVGNLLSFIHIQMKHVPVKSILDFDKIYTLSAFIQQCSH